MSFDQDPGEQAKISAADLAIMIDEMKALKSINKALVSSASYLLENIDEPPDSNCSCHISPPCCDCVDHSALREAIAEAKKAIEMAEGGES